MGSIDRQLNDLRTTEDSLMRRTQEFIEAQELQGEDALKLIDLVQSAYVQARQASCALSQVVKFDAEGIYVRFLDLKKAYQ